MLEMDIWDTRNQSNKWLQKELFEEKEALEIGFSLLDNCVSILESIGIREGDNLQRKLYAIGSLTLAKSTHLLFGCFSLTLDGLSQESGALLRPLIETYELLVYLRLDPNRVEEVTNDKLPSAGTIAQLISGKFYDLRKHLNEHASHFKYKYSSVSHLVDFNSKEGIKAFPSHILSTLKRNLNSLNAFQIILLSEVAYWLESNKYETDKIINTLRIFCEKSDIVFPINFDT